MATGQTKFTDLSVDAMTLIKDETLSIIERNIVLGQHAVKIPLPQHNSKTIQFTRYKRLPLPQTVATEGVTPSSTKLENEIVTAIVDQWVMIVELSDISRLTIKHSLVPIVEDRLGIAKAELVEREIYKSLLAAPVVFAGSGNLARGDLAAGDVLNATEVRKLWAILRRNGARMEGRHYLMVLDPEQSQDISNEQKFIDSVQFANARALFNNEIGEYLGFRVQVSNSLPVIDLIADADWTSALVGTGGPFANTNVVRVKITAVDDLHGYEQDVSNVDSLTITASDENVDVTVPATTGFTYNVYVNASTGGSGDSTLHLQTSGLAPSAVYRLTGFQTTGANPPAQPATGVAVHTAFVFGREAYGMVQLSGDNLKVLVTPDVPSDSDPALQRKKISLKGSFKSFIMNNDYIRRVESSSAF